MTAIQKMIGGFLIGLAVGGAIAGGFGLYELDVQNEKHIATLKQVGSDWNQNTVVQSQTIFESQARAEACEAKFTGGTVIYELRPAYSVPVLNGALTLSLGSAANPDGEQLAPVWYVPAEVTPQTSLPGARYQWVDLLTGAARGGMMAAMPPAGAR